MFCVKRVFLKISGLRPATLFKKRLWHKCLPVNFAKFFRAPFFYRTLKGAASISNCVNSKTGLHRYFGDKKKFVIENFELY